MPKRIIKIAGYPYFDKVLFCIAFLMTVIFIVTGSYIQGEERVQVGVVAPRRYVALVDTVDESATSQLKQEAFRSVGPLYKHDENVQKTTFAEMDGFFLDLNDILANLEEGAEFAQTVKNATLKLPVVLTVRECEAYEKLNEQGRELFQKTCRDIANVIYEQGITAESMEKGRELIKTELSAISWSANLKDMGYAVLKSTLKPNLIIDGEAIQMAREKRAGEVPDVIIKKNQKIVDEGEIITEDIFKQLETLNLINHQDYKKSIVPIMGSITIVALIFIAGALFFYGGKKTKKLKRNEMLMLFTLYFFAMVLLRLTSEVPVYTMIPLTLFPMLVSLLLNMRMAMILNCFISIIGCFIFNGDVEFLLYFFMTGSFAALLIQYTERRKYIIVVAGAMAGVNFLCMLAMGLFFEQGYSNNLLISGGYGAISGLLSVMIAIGSLPFWETAFEANTPLRLLELTNPNNELLRRLMLEAPGTYHHSLVVANLAETAAYEIGANSTLARVGAYYHDIGKLKYPLYFGENQGGDNPHDSLEPYSSAQLIIQHVKDGAEMGNEKGLPKAVISMIQEHHGNTLVKYFYFKALKLYGNEEVKESDYRYDGPVPQSREAAIIMLADTVEAAMRSMIGNVKKLEEAEKLIQTLIKDKLDDGQLEESSLTIEDLTTIRKAFLTVFHGMYHDRIAYPKAEELKEAQIPKNIVSIESDIGKEEIHDSTY